MREPAKRFRTNTFIQSSAAFVMDDRGDSPNARSSPSPASSQSSPAKNPVVTRADVLALMRRKDEIEAELKALQDVLQSQGNVGMEGPLLDGEGYPRSDIDVYSVRHARHKIICLNNDHKALMKDIEEGLYAVHEQARHEYMDVDEKKAEDNNEVKSFAKIQFVSPESPAASAGLEPGDLITAFGSVSSANFRSLADLATVVSNSENRAISVEVRRHSVNKRIALTPRKWNGRGLLGCSFLEERQM
ncbi:26S proteasome non-ATPase regulatory subunit 9-like [Paramacrobiotus metropolitanus]|uniref:26S proteasome non-ATPase regulatory subunit 9-like n=1 Tax=Paramacrobiotus metropolitanus TaxID=2943436 RepID=UPI00244622E5|nr:26S proteasome non-ATPase regulatory subunit 9-like [Paramacrobiotus metropolitanus]